MANTPNDPSQGSGRAGAENVQNQSQFYELLVKSNAEAEKQNELLKQRASLLELTAKELKSETELQNSIATRLLQQVNEMEATNKRSLEATKKITESNKELKELKESLENLDQNSIMNQQFASELEIKIEQKNKEILKLKEQELDIQKDLFKYAGISEEQSAKYGDLLKIRVLDGVELSKVLKEEAFSEQQKRDALEEAKAINKDFLQLQTKTRNITEKVAGNLGLAASFGDTHLGFAVDMHKRYLQMSDALGGKDAMLGSMYKIASQSFNFKNILGSVVEFAAKSALEISNISRNLGAATGFGDKFNNELAVMAQRGNMAGITFQESGQALKSLAGGLSSFNPNAEKTNINLGMTVARLEKLGVSSASSVKIIDHLQRAMGMGAESAADMTAEIARMGKEIGITGTKMIEQFTSAAGRLAIYGQRGTRVFKELAAAAKATGIEMSTLLGITKKFDTFEGAAQQASQLNAVLGTQLSTLELLQASDSERIMMIKQQVQMSVGNFENLDKFTKMYVAQAMGVSDVAEAQRLLNMSTAEYQKYVAGQQKSADIQKELAEATEELVPMMQQLKLAGTQILMVFKPIITVFSGIINAISFLIGLIAKFIPNVDAGGKVIEYITGVVMLAALAFKAFGVSMLTALGPIGLIIAGLTLVFGAFHLKGSPELWELPEHSGKGYENMANSMGIAAQAANATSASMKKVHDSFHKAGGKSFSIEAMAKLDTEKIAAGLTKVKSAMMELSTLKIDGFLAMSTDGAKSSIVMGSQGVIKSLSEGKLAIDVNMPEIALPPINVVVKVNDANLAGVIDARVEKRSL